MKKQFSTHWKASKQPRKQRKYIAKAPLHIKRKFLSMNLSKELRKKYGKRNVAARKGDTVRIMRGKFRKKSGKIIQINTKKSRVMIEGIQVKKRDGSKVNVKLHPSNMQITELNLEDKKRGLTMKKTESRQKTESLTNSSESQIKETKTQEEKK